GQARGSAHQPRPPCVSWDGDPDPAHLAEPAHDVDGKLVLPLVLVDDRRDLLLHEVADRRPEELVLRVEVEVHRAGAYQGALRAAPPRRSNLGRPDFLLASPHTRGTVCWPRKQ